MRTLPSGYPHAAGAVAIGPSVDAPTLAVAGGFAGSPRVRYSTCGVARCSCWRSVSRELFPNAPLAVLDPGRPPRPRHPVGPFRLRLRPRSGGVVGVEVWIRRTKA